MLSLRHHLGIRTRLSPAVSLRGNAPQADPADAIIALWESVASVTLTDQQKDELRTAYDADADFVMSSAALAADENGVLTYSPDLTSTGIDRGKETFLRSIVPFDSATAPLVTSLYGSTVLAANPDDPRGAMSASIPGLATASTIDVVMLLDIDAATVDLDPLTVLCALGNDDDGGYVNLAIGSAAISGETFLVSNGTTRWATSSTFRGFAALRLTLSSSGSVLSINGSALPGDIASGTVTPSMIASDDFTICGIPWADPEIRVGNHPSLRSCAVFLDDSTAAEAYETAQIAEATAWTPPQIWHGYDSVENDQLLVTFSGQDIGAASASRRVIVGLVTRLGLSAEMSIGGVSATKHDEITQVEDNQFVLSLFSANVPTGDVADIVITFGSISPGTNGWVAIGVWSIPSGEFISADKASIADLDSELSTELVTQAEDICIVLGLTNANYEAIVINNVKQQVNAEGPSEQFDVFAFGDSIAVASETLFSAEVSGTGNPNPTFMLSANFRL